MVDNEGWTFEAWRTCPACGGTGEPEPPPDGRIRIGQQGVAMFSGQDVCETCNRHEDALKRVGQERRVFTLNELPPELKD